MIYKRDQWYKTRIAIIKKKIMYDMLYWWQYKWTRLLQEDDGLSKQPVISLGLVLRAVRSQFCIDQQGTLIQTRDPYNDKAKDEDATLIIVLTMLKLYNLPTYMQWCTTINMPSTFTAPCKTAFIMTHACNVMCSHNANKTTKMLWFYMVRFISSTWHTRTRSDMDFTITGMLDNMIWKCYSPNHLQ